MRNCNPLNIRRVAGTRWKGQSAEQNDPQFVQFETMDWGLRAAFVLLRTYAIKYKAVCIENHPLGTANGKRHPKVHIRLMQAHRLRRQRKAHRKRLAKARQTDGSDRMRRSPLRGRNPKGLRPLQGNENSPPLTPPKGGRKKIAKWLNCK